MARVRDFAVTEYGTATTASIACNMPVHAVNDLLIFFASKDGTPVVNDPGAGWTSLQDGASAGAAYRCGYKVAASAAETLTLTTPTTENWHVVVVAIEGAPTTTPISASAESGADDSAMPFAGPATNTGSDTNCLILHAWFADSGLSPTAYPPLVNLHAGDNGANSAAVAYTFQKAAGAVAAASWFGRGNDDGRGVVVAVKDGSSGTIVCPYSDPAVSSATSLRPLVGLSTMFSDSWPATLSLTCMGKSFDSVLRDVGPGTFTDYTSAADSYAANAGDVVFPTAITDFMYFGSSAPFRYMAFGVVTAGVGGVITWEYWTGAAWSSTGMPTNNLTATGWQRLDLTAAIMAAMAQTSVNGVTKYWVRANIATLYSTGITASLVFCDAMLVGYLVATAAGDAGTNPYTDATQNAGSSSLASMFGCEILFGAALNMSAGIITGTIRPVLARDFAVDIGSNLNPCGGVQMTLLDTNLNRASFKIGARGCKNLDLDGRSVYAIDWNGSAVAWAGSTATIAKNAVTRMLLTTLGQYGAAAVQWSMLNLVTRLCVAGGTSGRPLSLEDIAYVTNRCVGMFPYIQLAGAAAMIWAPLQFGGGDPVAINCDLNTFQLPTRYDGTLNFGWNAAEDVAGIKFYPLSGDSIKITNSVFTSASRYRWEWDASSNAGATIDFTGSTVINANVTLRDLNTAFAFMAFINCPIFTQNAAEIEDCAFTNTKVDASSPANAAKIRRCSFTKTTGTQHGMEISGSAADFSLEGCTFTGYAAGNGSTGNEAIYVNIATGSVQISITGGGGTPSIRTAGATVTVVNARNLTLSPIVAGSDVVIYAAGTTTVIESVQDLAGTSYVYDYPAAEAGNSIDIAVFKAGYVPFFIRGYTKSSADASVPVSQVVDRFYIA